MINNAGVGDYALFDHSDWNRIGKMIQPNVVALTYLTHEYVGQMVQRKRGGILNISSGFGLLFGSERKLLCLSHIENRFRERTSQ